MSIPLFRRRRLAPGQPVQQRSSPAPRRFARLLLLVLLGLLAFGAAAITAIWLALRLLLAPATGEWALPLRAGPVEVAVGVPSMIRLATAPWLGPWLDGLALHTRWGPVRATWAPATNTLHLRCAPCSVAVPALGTEPLRAAPLTLSVRRSFETLEGELLLADDTRPLRLHFKGDLRQQGLTLRVTGEPTPIAQWYAVLAPGLPELRRARIDGSVALQAKLDLPSGRFSIGPTVTAFEVRGLGTETLFDAASSCGKPSRLRPDDWLTRAVIAAEDQRFYEHPGYDLRELTAALSANHASAAVERGGSTITQQLAKRIATGDERSLQRKLSELLYAVEMEQTLGKARILRLYLDNAPWGAGICGAEAAARHYFHRNARGLAPAQAVWLAAMLHNPEAEARQWAGSGSINLPRAQWVAEGVRGVPGLGRRLRAEVVSQLGDLGSSR